MRACIGSALVISRFRVKGREEQRLHVDVRCWNVQERKEGAQWYEKVLPCKILDEVQRLHNRSGSLE